MIICNQCGAPLTDQMRFCGECGAAIVPGAPSVVVNPVPPPPIPPLPPVPRSSIALPLVVLGVILGGVILGGGLLLLLGISARRSNTADNSSNYNSISSTNTANWNSINTSNVNRNTNYNRSIGNNSSSNYNANANSNVARPSSVSPFQYAEDKILSNRYLSASDISGLTSWELKLLRNTVFAKRGRTFPKEQDAALQQHFNSRPWYRPNYNYNSNEQQVDLYDVEEANLAVIKATENYRSP